MRIRIEGFEPCPFAMAVMRYMRGLFILSFTMIEHPRPLRPGDLRDLHKGFADEEGHGRRSLRLLGNSNKQMV